MYDLCVFGHNVTLQVLFVHYYKKAFLHNGGTTEIKLKRSFKLRASLVLDYVILICSIWYRFQTTLLNFTVFCNAMLGKMLSSFFFSERCIIKKSVCSVNIVIMLLLMELLCFTTSGKNDMYSWYFFSHYT